MIGEDLMKIDLYTKAVLTVIAACLVWICVSGVTPVAQAQAPQAASPPPTRVMLVDEDNRPIHAQGLRVHFGGMPVPVDVGTSPLPVALRSIQRGGAWDSFDVRVLREAPTTRPTP